MTRWRFYRSGDKLSTAALHDTELCAWWVEPCESGVYSQDLCRVHYNKAWWAKDQTPLFQRVRLGSHLLKMCDDGSKTAVCTTCGPTSFGWKPNGRRICVGARNSSHRWRKTGWSSHAYDMAVVAQGNRCAVCGNSPVGRGLHNNLVADHCHAKLTTRKLLCGQCNHVLGLMQDDSAVLRRAADYLDQHAKE